jgi:hypothetical protein
MGKLHRLEGGALPAAGTLEVVTDDFDDGVISPLWRLATGAVEAGGVLTLSSGGVLSQSEDWSNTHLVDARGKSWQVEIAQFGHASVGIYSNGGSVYGAEWDAGAGTLLIDDVASIPLDPVAHRFLRWTLANPTTRVYASPDGVTWTELGTIDSSSSYGEFQHARVTFEDLGGPTRTKIASCGMPGAATSASMTSDRVMVLAALLRLNARPGNRPVAPGRVRASQKAGHRFLTDQHVLDVQAANPTLIALVGGDLRLTPEGLRQARERPNPRYAVQ